MISHVQLTEQGEFLRKIPAGENIEWDANNYCSAFALEKDGKAGQFKVHPFYTAAEPVYDPITQELRELDPAPVDGLWTQRWQVIDLPPKQIEANKQAADAAMIAVCDAALTAHLDATAKQRRYDNRITCALRAGYPGPFQAEGAAFALWMDNCNALAYQMLAEVQAGTRPLPTSPQALIDLLPPMEWPA